ncbi:dephospho-CoA kinase [Christiangramia sp. OXR-203]|jgi:dephospho-CoA kinase|uniref:dephospho-CoA kinase n=1 Tax=Christiangramia sp. OXR-203 TaxID=3100176 RepID=UPI002AC8F6B2|nr:dephospho-CoA kinase [Christiangramia sp. OXR-203]WPY97825.1 dephospho-CoA kinase [Christiangramia sp. OXR-203]
MKIVGLTGGIGSGKTTVAGFFKDLGIPVYIADDAGKRLLEENSDIREKVSKLLGVAAYNEQVPDRKYIANKVFKDKDLLEKLNAIIHPAVASDFQDWVSKQTSEYIIYEAAILFEAGGYKKCDLSILVTAPHELKIGRLQKRDDSTVEEIEARMGHQWPDEKKAKLADFLIENKDLQQTKQEVSDIHIQILKAREN